MSNKLENLSIQINQNKWVVTSTSFLTKALVEHNLINYLETIKPFYNNQEYFED